MGVKILSNYDQILSKSDSQIQPHVAVSSQDETFLMDQYLRSYSSYFTQQPLQHNNFPSASMMNEKVITHQLEVNEIKQKHVLITNAIRKKIENKNSELEDVNGRIKKIFEEIDHLRNLKNLIQMSVHLESDRKLCEMNEKKRLIPEITNTKRKISIQLNENKKLIQKVKEKFENDEDSKRIK